MPTRRAVLTSAAGLALAATIVPAYALVVEPGFRLRITRYHIAPPNWPAGLDLTIAILADIHAAEPHMPVSRVARIVEAANALAPDVTLLLGDYTASHRFVTSRVPVEECAAALAGLRAPLGVFSILGNHDWWDDKAVQRAKRGPPLAASALREAGLPLLENDAVRLEKDGRPFWLAGLGDQIAFIIGHSRFRGVDDLAGTLARVTDDAPVILLAHEPDIFPMVPDRVALTLSGHTHGGQVRLMGYSPIVPSAFGNRFAYGHVIEKGRHLVVSGGLGTSIAPVRLGVPPEIVLVRLAAAL